MTTPAFDENPARPDCLIIRRNRHETRIALIVTAAVGLGLMVAGVASAFDHLSISGNSSGSLDGATSAGLVLFTTSAVVYTIAIPQMNRKYRRCLKHL